MKKLIAILAITAMSTVPLSAVAVEVGERVLVWYSARVNSTSGSKLDLNFDAGDVRAVRYDRVRNWNWRVGTRVQCNWKRGGAYYSGVNSSMRGERIGIDYDGGDQSLNYLPLSIVFA